MGVKLNAIRKHIASTQPIRYTPTIELNIILDVLDGCRSRCPGCFVNKENKFTDQYLKDIEDITNQYTELGLEANELFLGPTDIFACDNLEEVLADERFEQIVRKYKALTFTSAMTQDPKILKKELNRVNDILVKNHRHCELFVVIDIIKWMRNDRKYLDVFEENLRAIEECNKNNEHLDERPMNVFFLVNYYKGILDLMDFAELHQRLRDEYQVKTKINPSFGRAASPRIVKKFMNDLKEDLERQVNKDNINNVFINTIDIYFGGETYQNYAYTDGKLYVTPFLYDFIPVEDEKFEVKRGKDGRFYVDDMFNKVTELTERQYLHAPKTQECNSCEFLPNCAARHFLAYMEHHNIDECLMPKGIFATSYKDALEEYND